MRCKKLTGVQLRTGVCHVASATFAAIHHWSLAMPWRRCGFRFTTKCWLRALIANNTTASSLAATRNRSVTADADRYMSTVTAAAITRPIAPDARDTSQTSFVGWRFITCTCTLLCHQTKLRFRHRGLRTPPPLVKLFRSVRFQVDMGSGIRYGIVLEFFHVFIGRAAARLSWSQVSFLMAVLERFQ